MLDLYLSELRRLRTGALLFALGHVVALAVLQAVLELTSAPLVLQSILLFLYALAGLGLAVHQFAIYRQPSRWIWLQHRPLHRARILAALVLATLTVAVVALTLPICTVLAMQAHFTAHVIDSRFYAGAVWITLTALSAWLCGATLMLHRSRWACLVFGVPVVLTLHLASAPTMLALALACNGLLLVVLYSVFRTDRTARGAAATLANAIPLQIGFYLALAWGGAMAFHVGLMLVGGHPYVGGQARAGSVLEALRTAPAQRVLGGLAGSADPRALAWQTALARADAAGTVARVGPDIRQFAPRDPIATKSWLSFGADGIDWTFSHDRMMYRGQNTRTKGDAGWFGSAGRGATGAFTSAPVRLSDNHRESWLVAAHDTYAIDRDATRVHHVLHLHGDETFGGGVATVDKRLLVLTNRRLVVLDDAFVPRAQVALPIPFDDLAAVDAARVGDGLLVSFLGGQRQRDGVVASPQVVELLAGDGAVREVGRRELQHTLPALFEHVDWWVSPALSALVALPDRLIDDGGVHGPDGGALPLLGPRPAVVWCAAGAGMLLALAGGLWWTRAWTGAARMDTRTRAAWCLACLVFGLPVLLSLMVLRPRPRLVRSAAATDRAAWERALP